MEILPYCVCCCVRGISQSLQLCSISHNRKERKDASQKQNKRIKSQATLQTRRKQEKAGRERRKKDLLAITFQRDLPRLGLGGTRHLEPSESRDELQELQQGQQRHLARVHSDQAAQSDQADQGEDGRKLRRDVGERKVGRAETGTEAERRERIEKVEQTTVHTVITRHEKLDKRHLPSLTADNCPAVHRAGRAGSISSENAGEQLAVRSAAGGRAGGLTDPRHRHSDPAGGVSGAGHLRSLVKTDPLESRADGRKAEILKMRLREKEKKQRRLGQERKDAKNAKQNKLGGAGGGGGVGGGAKRKK